MVTFPPSPAGKGGRGNLLSELVLAGGTVLLVLSLWVFPFIPTQDGPALLATALAFKDYGEPGARFQEFYVLNCTHFPNWTGFALVAVLCRSCPPLVAEKILATIYVVGFIYSYRYFVKSIHPSSSWLPFVVFNHCFWLGFYNFCLGTAVYWLTLGYLHRRLSDLRTKHTAILCVLFLGCYYTHLFAFVLVAVSSVWLAITGPQMRVRNTALVCGSLVPAIALTWAFLGSAQYFSAAGISKFNQAVVDRLANANALRSVARDIVTFDARLLGPPSVCEGSIALAVLLLYGAFYWAYMVTNDGAEFCGRVRHGSQLLLGIGLAMLYLLVPNFFSFTKGGFLKNRLAIFPPLLWLACCEESRLPSVRWTLRVVTIGLICIRLVDVLSWLGATNRSLIEFTAGKDYLGDNKTILMTLLGESRGVDPFRHAASYYCLGSGNIDLNNVFGLTRHSPVRFHSRLAKGTIHFGRYKQPELVDAIVVWGPEEMVDLQDASGFVPRFRAGRLKIMTRADIAPQPISDHMRKRE